MNAWPEEELAKITAADDLHIAPFRDDGATYGTLTWIWSVTVDDQLYVRAYNGAKSRWYQAALRQKRGRVESAGVVKQVDFTPVDNQALGSRIDEAYRRKYASSPYLAPMIGTGPKAATILITPA